MVPFLSIRADHNQRGTARAQQKARVLRLLPRDSEHSAPALREKRSAGLVLGAVAGTLHHGRALKEGGLSPTHYFF